MTLKNLFVAFAAILLSFPVWISPTPAQAAPLDCKKSAAIGAGVQRVKKDQNGALKSLVVVGQASIATSLGKRGLLVAKKSAGVNAQGEFAKWLKSNVKIKQSAGVSTLVATEGTEQGGVGQSTSSAKSTESFSEVTESQAQAQVRALSPICADQDSETGFFTIIYGWSPANAALAGEAAVANEAGIDTSPESGQAGNGEQTTVESKTTVSDEASEY